MDDEGPPRKRLQSDQQSGQQTRSDQQEKRIAELERLLAEQSATIRELNISLEAARQKSELIERIIDEKERIIDEKERIIERIIDEKENAIKAQKDTIKAQKDASENEANLRTMAAEKKYRDKATMRVREATEEANRRLKEATDEANRRLEEANRRENLLRQDLHQANRRLDEANRRENNLIRELAKAQDLHQQTKNDGKVMFGFLETGIKAFDRLSQTKCAIADRHGEKITHLKTVGKLLGEEQGTFGPYGMQVVREDPESQHLSGHRYTMVEGIQASINDRCATPIGRFIPTVNPDAEYLRFQSTCKRLMNCHTLVPSGLVFNLTFHFPFLEWTDASPGNLFTKEEVERALRDLSGDVEEDTLSKLTDSVNALVVAVPQDKNELQVETTNIRSKLKHITEWMKENAAKVKRTEPIKRRLTC